MRWRARLWRWSAHSDGMRCIWFEVYSGLMLGFGALPRAWTQDDVGVNKPAMVAHDASGRGNDLRLITPPQAALREIKRVRVEGGSWGEVGV